MFCIHRKRVWRKIHRQYFKFLRLESWNFRIDKILFIAFDRVRRVCFLFYYFKRTLYDDIKYTRSRFTPTRALFSKCSLLLNYINRRDAALFCTKNIIYKPYILKFFVSNNRYTNNLSFEIIELFSTRWCLIWMWKHSLLKWKFIRIDIACNVYADKADNISSTTYVYHNSRVVEAYSIWL